MAGKHKNQRDAQCITYVPMTHTGTGWVQTCVSIIENFPIGGGLTPTLVIPQVWNAVSKTVDVQEAIPWPLRFVPYRYLSRLEQPTLERRFKACAGLTQSGSSIAYFWPAPSIALIRYARERGMITVREMINTPVGTAKSILDSAYLNAGLPPNHGVTDLMVKKEIEELSLYDYIFASNTMVESALLNLGIEQSKILRSTFGWDPARYSLDSKTIAKDGFRAVFVGSICVRKGVPQLLAAWKQSGVVGELLLAGEVEAALKPMLDTYVKHHNVRVLGFVADVGDLYKSADIFVFPTLEEGGPQVTYEAAGFGLPVITTPMGSARIIKNGINGFVVDPYDIHGLARAISRLAEMPALRSQFGKQAALDAKKFTYQNVGAERAEILKGLLVSRRRMM